MTWNEQDFTQAAASGSITFAPNTPLRDAADGVEIGVQARTYHFVNGTGTSDPLVATDNASLLPSGWAYVVTVALAGLASYSFDVFIRFADGVTQSLSSLSRASQVPALESYLPLPTGSPQAGYVPVWTGPGEVSAWGPNGTGGSGFPATPVVSGTPSSGQVLTATDATHANWQTPSSGGGGITPPAGDIGGTTVSPTVVSTHLSAALPVAQGGTGQATQQAAIDALTGAQSAGKVLRSDGTHATLSSIQAGDVPTLNQNTTGTAANVTGTVAIGNGGTGQVTQQAALDALAGAVTSGQVLRGNGTHVLLAALQAGDIPALAESQITGLVADLAAKAALAGMTLTGWFAPAVVALTFGATISVNAALGNVFAVTLTASTGTIANPTNPVDGQVIKIRVAQDATGSRTVSWGTAYDFGSAGTPTLSTAASKVDILGFEYVASLSKWVYLNAAFPQGF